MTNHEIIEPGSRDLDEVMDSLRIGGAATDNLADLIANGGNKMVVAEHFVDREGNPIDAERFDNRTMAYSLFIAPIPDKAHRRHKEVLSWHRKNGLRGKTGTVVGGGLLDDWPGSKLALNGMSGDFKQEPLLLRKRFSELLLPFLQERFGSEIELAQIFQTGDELLFGRDLNSYWMQYKQILEAGKRTDPQKTKELIARFTGWQQHVASQKKYATSNE